MQSLCLESSDLILSTAESLARHKDQVHVQFNFSLSSNSDVLQTHFTT
uniref:Uncharacterized protein n=1 Tax=Anguilla anguilla TaxID=7936 RepID=A0A0E9RI56_ANGAN